MIFYILLIFKNLEKLCGRCFRTWDICVNTTVILDSGIKLTDLMNCDNSYPEIDTRFCSTYFTSLFTYARPTILGINYIIFSYKV